MLPVLNESSTLRTEHFPVNSAASTDSSRPPLSKTLTLPAFKTSIEHFIADDEDIEIIEADVIYHLIDAIENWREKVSEAIEAAQPSLTMRPARLLILPNHVFRRSQPAVVGVRVLDGMISIGQTLVHRDGRRVGALRSIRSGEEDKTQAHQGDEVAIAIDAGVVGRNFDEEDTLLGDLTEEQARLLIQTGNNVGEDSLEELLRLKRSKKHFWAR